MEWLFKQPDEMYGIIYLIIFITWGIYLDYLSKKKPFKDKTPLFRARIKKITVFVYALYLFFLFFILYKTLEFGSPNEAVSQGDRHFIQDVVFNLGMLMLSLTFYFSEIIGKVKFLDSMWEEISGFIFGITISSLFEVTYHFEESVDVIFCACLLSIGFSLRVFYKWWRSA